MSHQSLMNIHPTVTALTAALLFSTTGTTQETRPGRQPPVTAPYSLPKDPKAVVLTLDHEGGFTPARTDEAPYFVIRADGSMLVRDVFGLSSQPKAEGQLTAKQLQELLRFVIAEQQLTKWNDAAVARAMRDHKKNGGRMVRVADASTSIVKVSLPKHSVNASCNALPFIAHLVPEIALIQSMLAVENRLRHLAAVVVVGGTKKAEVLRAQANGALKAKYPAQEPFILHELSTAFRDSHNGLSASFVRTISRPDGGRKRIWATVALTEAGKPTVEVQETETPF